MRKKRRLRSRRGVYMPPTSSQHLLNTFSRQENASRCLCSQKSSNTSDPNTSCTVTRCAVCLPFIARTPHIVCLCPSKPRDSRLAARLVFKDVTASCHTKCSLLSHPFKDLPCLEGAFRPRQDARVFNMRNSPSDQAMHLQTHCLIIDQGNRL